MGIDSAGAVFLLHVASKFPEAQLPEALKPIIQLVEREYFGADLHWLNVSSPYARLLIDCNLVEEGSKRPFRDLVHGLPLPLKALMLKYQDDRILDKTGPEAKKTREEEVRGRWHTLDPVDMEEVERDHYLKTKQVLRTRHVKAKPSRMRTGSRLAQVLGKEMLESWPNLNAPDLCLLLKAITGTSRNAVFHRDLKMDAQFAICKRLMEFSEEDIGQNVLDISLALSSFESCLEIPSRVWNRKVIPALREGSVRLDSADDWGLFAASLMASGRVRVTSRLGGYMFPNLIKNIGELSIETCMKLLDGMQMAGYFDSQFLALLSDQKAAEMPLLALGKLIQTRSHFGLFGPGFDSLGLLLFSKLENGVSEFEQFPVSKQLMILNNIHADEPPQSIIAITKNLFRRLPDLDPACLGRIDTVLE